MRTGFRNNFIRQYRLIMKYVTDNCDKDVLKDRWIRLLRGRKKLIVANDQQRLYKTMIKTNDAVPVVYCKHSFKYINPSALASSFR